MIVRASGSRSVEKASSFSTQVLEKLPLAEATLSLWDFIMEPDFLLKVFAEHRGRSFADVITFPVFVDLMADALVEHQGSGRQAFTRARQRNNLPGCVEAVYGKLRRVPVSLSQGFLEEATARLRTARPDGLNDYFQPASLAEFTVTIVDGKILKDVAKRLMVSRGKAGKLYGGKLLVAYVPAEGLARSFVADLDGETNDAKLIPLLIPRARQAIDGPRLWVLDCQFCDLTQPVVLAQEGDHFLIRFHPKNSFELDPSRPTEESTDAAGRTVFDEWGWLGGSTSKRRLFVRRIRLQRPGEDEIILVTDLIEKEQYTTIDLLAAYLERWGIERVFQQVTEVFNLEHLIGSTPQATIFQASFCLTLYNVLQVIRQHLALAQPEPLDPEELSTEQIFVDVKRQLITVSELVPSHEITALIPKGRTLTELKAHLKSILQMDIPKLWYKARNKKPRPHPKKVKHSGAHTSVARLINAAKNPIQT